MVDKIKIQGQKYIQTYRSFKDSAANGSLKFNGPPSTITMKAMLYNC